MCECVHVRVHVVCMLTGEIHKNTNIKLTLLCIAPDTSQSDGSQSQPCHNPPSVPPTISKTKNNYHYSTM